jgi:hypothetical protein
MPMNAAQLDSLIKLSHKRRGWFGKDLRTDPCPKCDNGEMHYQLLGPSHIFVCDRCSWIDWNR